MARPKQPNDDKTQSLKKCGALNPHPKKVAEKMFSESALEFFDPRDLVQPHVLLSLRLQPPPHVLRPLRLLLVHLLHQTLQVLARVDHPIGAHDAVFIDQDRGGKPRDREAHPEFGGEQIRDIVEAAIAPEFAVLVGITIAGQNQPQAWRFCRDDAMQGR